MWRFSTAAPYYNTEIPFDIFWIAHKFGHLCHIHIASLARYNIRFSDSSGRNKRDHDDDERFQCNRNECDDGPISIAYIWNDFQTVTVNVGHTIVTGNHVRKRKHTTARKIYLNRTLRRTHISCLLLIVKCVRFSFSRVNKQCHRTLRIHTCIVIYPLPSDIYTIYLSSQ